MARKKYKPLFDVLAHELVPFHRILTKSETEALLKKYSIDLVNLPRIRKSDPVARALGARFGDVIKIIRKSETTVNSAVSYRFVVKKTKK